MHPLVQWGRLLGIDDPSQDTTSDVGWLDPGLIAALAPILGDATTTQEISWPASGKASTARN
jgi:hypothetical protein